MCSNPELFKQEKEHLREALTKCKYPKWALDKVKKRPNRSSSETLDGANNQGTTGTSAATKKVKGKGRIVIPYTQGLCESIKKICGRYGIQTHFKKLQHHQEPPGLPQDKNPMVTQSHAIYWYQCGDLGCDDECIGEPPGPLVKDTKNTQKDPSPIHHHNNQTNHSIIYNNFKIIRREGAPSI